MTVSIKSLFPASKFGEAVYRWSFQLERITRQVFASGDHDNGVTLLLKEIGGVLDADRVVVCSISMRDTVTVLWEALVQAGLPSMVGRSFQHHGGFKAAQHSGGLIMGTADAAGKEAVPEDAEIIRRVHEDYRIQTSLLFPLVHDGVVYGYLCVHDCHGTTERTAEDLAFLRILGMLLGGYLHGHVLRANMRDVITDFLARFSALAMPVSVSPEAMSTVLRRDTTEAEEEHLVACLPELSRREREVLLRLDQPNKAIARDLGLAESTIKGHVGAILQKLGHLDRRQTFRKVRKCLTSHGFESRRMGR